MPFRETKNACRKWLRLGGTIRAYLVRDFYSHIFICRFSQTTAFLPYLYFVSGFFSEEILDFDDNSFLKQTLIRDYYLVSRIN